MSTLQRILLRCWYYYALSLGISAHIFNFEERTFRESRWLRWYCVSNSIFAIILVPYYWWRSRIYTYFYSTLPLLQLIIKGRFFTHVLLSAYTYGWRLRQDRQFCALARRLITLERRFFSARSHSTEYDTSYKWVFYAKYAMLWYHCISMLQIYIMDSQYLPLSWEYILVTLYFFNYWNHLHGTMFCYFLTLLHICRRFTTLSELCEEILLSSQQELQTTTVITFATSGYNQQQQQQEQREPDLLSKLQHLLLIHWQLKSIALQLHALFAVHILGLQNILFIINIATFYGFFLSLANWQGQTLWMLYLVVSFFVKLFDIFLLNYCCCELLLRQAELRQVLHKWQLKSTTVGRGFDRLCERFDLDCTAAQLTFKVVGLFDFDRSIIFIILQNTLMAAIILMQFDLLLRN